MAFPKQVIPNYAIGNVGQISRLEHSYLATTMAKITDAECFVGCFVKHKDTGAVAYNEVTIANGKQVQNNEVIMGVALKFKYVNTNTNDATIKIPQGEDWQIMQKGCTYILADKAAKEGDYVFLDKQTGALAFSKDVANTNNVLTGFRVTKGTRGTAPTQNAPQIIEIMSV